MYAIDSYRKYRKEQNVKKEEQNVKLKVLREVNQQREDRILTERESCFPLHPYMYSTPLRGTLLEEEEKGTLKDNVTIECDDHGAEFFKVEINSSMNEVIHNPDLTFPHGLSWWHSSLTTSGALIVAQLSHFECGGIALRLCMSHKVGDACSAYYFLRDWAELTRDPKLTLSPPYFAKDSLMPSPFDGPLLSHVIEPKKKRCIQKMFVFSESKINALKALVVAESYVQNPTRNEVVSALLYKCAASSSTTNLGRSQLVLPLNLRSQASLQPPLPPTTIGNILTIFSTPIYENYERDLRLSKLVTNIRKSKHDLSTKNNIQENMFVKEMLDAYRTGKLPFQQRDCDVYMITSILAFEFEKLDFGLGKPARASKGSSPSSNTFILMNTPDDHDRGVEAFVNLNEEDMFVFINDKDLQFATPF
ncbi:acyltransferase Pun1-like [Solanum stenotomum]|uniref:acyltransferase Pun1-like n=1 Tax=Solanum stenotomum TaxID=172797 RepID=UPI0020D05AEB|nr:acyltransferase Pun1-like [Solanum stenotomum]